MSAKQIINDASSRGQAKSNGHTNHTDGAAMLPVGGNGRGKPRAPMGESRGLLTQELLKFRTDEIEIGAKALERGRYIEGDEDVTGTWADLDNLIGGVKWLVPDWVPLGMNTGIIAMPKAGKSAFAIWALIRPLVTGRAWFNLASSPQEPGYVVYCDTERSAAVNIDRMKRWGLPLERILTPFKDDPFRVIDIDNPAHIDRILSVVCKYKAKLVLVDSFRGSHKGDENNSKISSGLQALGGIAEETGAGCTIIHHTRKMEIGQDMTMDCGRGSNAFLAAVRCQLAIDVPDPKSPARRLQVMGENLGIAPKPIGFTINPNGLEFGDAPQRPPKAKKETGKDDCAKWLRVRLKPGSWAKAKEVEMEAEALGFPATGKLQRAREELGITLAKQNMRKGRDGWEWRLPVQQEITDPPDN